MEAVSQKAREIIENPELEEKIHEAIGSATTAADALTDIKKRLVFNEYYIHITSAV